MNKEKQLAYSTEYARFKKAINEEFFLEAIAIGYAIIEDRLVAFLHHAGIVTRDHEDLKINRCVYPYLRRLMHLEENHPIRIKDLSVKTNLVTELLRMDDERAQSIDLAVEEYLHGVKRKSAIAAPGFMYSLYLQLAKVDHEGAFQTLSSIEPWRHLRNDLIHALLKKTVAFAAEAKKECASRCYDLTRQIDDRLVKPFKRGNQLRKRYNIQ